MKKLVFYLISIVMFTGCSAHKREKKITAVEASNAPIEEQLVSAAKSIESSLATLAAAQKSNNPPLLNIAPLITPEGGMGGTIDMDWTGPIAPLLSKLARITGYELKILGKAPAIPVLVSITQTKAVIADVLKNASLQTGRNASILVFPATKVIELRYKAV